MFLFCSEDYGGAFKLLDSRCFLISCVIYLCPKLLIARGNQGEHSRGGARIMDWLFYVSPLKRDRIGNLSSPPSYIHHFCLTSVLLEHGGLFRSSGAIKSQPSITVI